MRTALVLIGFGLVAVLSGVENAHAGTLASAFVRGPATSQVQCIVSNIGTKAVTVVSVDIIDGAGNSVLVSNHCSATIAPGTNCAFSGPNYGRGIIVVQGITKNLRGQCVANDSNDIDVAASEMR